MTAATSDRWLSEWQSLKQGSENLTVFLTCSLLLASVLVKPLNRTIHTSLWFAESSVMAIASAFDTKAPTPEQKMIQGDYVAAFPVSSAFGNRIHPVLGTEIFHNGSDLATPIGTPIYAPVDASQYVNVACSEDANGGGLVASITHEAAKGRIQLLHMEDCTPGRHKGGSAIAKTGNTGISTGPHLHIQLRDEDEGYVEPRKGLAWYLITGRKMK